MLAGAVLPAGCAANAAASAWAMTWSNGRRSALWPLRVAAGLVARRGQLARAVQLCAAEATWRTQHGSAVRSLWTLSSVTDSDEDLGAVRADSRPPD